MHIVCSCEQQTVITIYYHAAAAQVVGEVQGPTDKLAEMKVRWQQPVSSSRLSACLIAACCATGKFRQLHTFVTLQSDGAPSSHPLQHWLGHVGSPSSSISKLDVAEERALSSLEYNSMDRRPNVP